MKTLLLSVIVFLIFGCQPHPRNSQITQSQDKPTHIVKLIDYITTNSFQELILESDLVVLGKVVKSGEVINTARDPNKINRPALHYFSIGQIYSFAVDRYLKNKKYSDLDTSLFVIQHEGEITATPVGEISPEDIQTAKDPVEDIPFELGSEYLLYLRKAITFTTNESHFTGVAHPWRFLVYRGCVYPETPWEGAKYYFPVQPLDEFLAEIEKALVSDSPILTAGWPLPTLKPTSSHCAPYPYGPQPRALSGTPYP